MLTIFLRVNDYHIPVEVELARVSHDYSVESVFFVDYVNCLDDFVHFHISIHYLSLLLQRVVEGLLAYVKNFNC